MNRHFVFFAFALLIALFTIAPCWGTIDVDIAISTQPNWISQQAADREANEIVSRVRNSVNDIRVFTKDQESQLASWVQSHTNNGQLDVLILFGVFPDSIYPSGNKQTDGSIAEKFLEAGNMIINTADYMFYIPYNAELGIRNMMDLQDVTMWFGGDMKVTNSGNQYLPSLSPYTTTRALKLDGIKSPWTVETVFAQNTEGTLAEPVVVRDTATGGRLAIFYQLVDDNAPRGEVISEFILNWLPTVAGGTVEPDDGVTPPDTPGEFVLMGTDPDEYRLEGAANIYQVFASSDTSKINFKVTSYRNWGEYEDFYVNMDADQNPNTGDPVNGVDYVAYVSLNGGSLLGGLWAYVPSERDYVATNATIEVLFKPNSDVFQVNVSRSDVGNPDAIDFDVWFDLWMIEQYLPGLDLEDVYYDDYAPDVGFYTYNLTGTGPVSPPGQIVLDFEDGSLGDWQVIDEADLNPSNAGTTPSSWQIRDSRMGLDGKVLYQGSNTYGDRAGTCAIGTFIIYKAQQFTNFILEVDVVTTDNDGMGLVWAYTGTDRHYRGFMLNDSAWPTNPADGFRGPFAKVEKRISNNTPFYEHLSSTSGHAVYPVGQKHHWRLRVENGVHTFSIDGGTWQLYPQDNSYKSGYVGLVLAAQEGVEFDNFTITPLDGGTTPPEDTTPPVITSGPLVSNVTSSSALVSWSTDEVSDSVVQYGKTSSYGLTATGAGNVREHSVLLTSLSPDTTYYYRAGSTDSSGNTVWSIQRSFKTNAQGVIPPIGQGGPVIYLPFNEGSGRTAADATANGNNGTLQGNVTWVNGKYGKAIYINEDSADNMVVVRDSNTLDVTDAMTMAAWVYVESIPNLWSVIAIKEGSYMLHIQSIQPDFSVGLVLNVNGSLGPWPDSSVAKTSMNQWHHVVGVYDGDNQYTYIDGELKGTYARKGTIDVTDSDLVIGHDSRSWCNYRKTAQVIDEFMIFNRALSQAEIQQIMGGTIPSGQPPAGSPSMTASPSSVKPGQDISVSYSNAPGNNYDWIGMYRSGASNEEWLAWEYLYGKKSGTITFKAPATAGNYEFRMFENDKHDPSIATSNTVVVSSADSGGVTSGRVAYWPLDSNVNDAVGNHDGTAAGGATFVDDASRGMVFKVDGVSGHAVVPHASDISFSDSDSFTLSLWVKVLKLQNRWTAIVYKSREAGPWYGLWIDNGNRWAFGSSFGSNLLGSSVQTNVWHHVALVQQGKNSGNKRIIYLNGNVDAQSTAASSNGTGKLYMGGSPPNTWYDHLDGLIDDVAIYNRALSSEEIEAIASGAGGGTTQPPTGKKLTIPEVTAKPGESVTVPINVDDASGLAGADITVTYNSSILSFSEVKSTMLSSPYWMSPVANPDIPGSIILRMAGNAIPSGSGSIVDIIFTVSSSAAVGSEAPVSFESAEAFDASGQNIPISTQNGKVKITTPGIKGDVNGDGAVKSNDAILALRISAGLLTPTAQQLWAADMNDDGKVKSNDSILILRKSAGLTAPGSDLIAREGGAPVEPGRSTSLALGEAHGIAGESITVPLRVGNPDILAAGDVSISYDSSVLRAVSVSSESDMLMAFNLAEPGLVHIAFANSGGLDDHAIATLEFEIITDDVSPLAFRDVELYGGDALPIDVRKINGQFASWAIPPENSALLQNFPNPFNPETWIPYQLREDSEVTIRIYDATGGLVRGLELGHRSAGIYVSKDRAAYWDGRNEAGESVASGVYFYTIQAGKLAATRKMIVAQ